MITPKEQKKSFFQNWISVIGGICSIALFAALCFLIILDFLTTEHNPYVEAVTFLFLPFFLIVSLLLIPFGAWRERSQRRKRGFVKRFPRIDFNDPLHQKWALTTIGIVTLFLLFSMFGVYRTYVFTESVTFCGRLCHQVMKPEYAAYHNSPHARVTCVQCHIGPGAGWFVRSKLSGLYQVYATIVNKFPRPITTPVKNLRPAGETCEQCHWPKQFFGAVEQDHQYFLSDEANTEWRTQMLVFVGGGTRPHEKRKGIHWHMNINSKVYYIASDEKRQMIPWVKRVQSGGKEEIFVAEDSKFTENNPPKGEMRLMDCIDCHNRPSHLYRSPSKAVNQAIADAVISRSLPFVKREAVKALVVPYTSETAAREGIWKQMEDFYRKNYSEVWSTRKEELNRTIQAVVKIYESNFFPEMNVSWKVYPDNIGHFIFPGCFRCHDGKHKTSEGKIIANDCQICHSIITQGTAGAVESSVEGLEFKHPNDDEASWKELACYECHTGGLD